MFNLDNRLFVWKKFLSPTLFPIPNPFQRKGRRDGEVLEVKSDFFLFLSFRRRRNHIVFCELLYVFPPSSEWQTGYRKGRRDGKIPIPSRSFGTIRRKGRRDGKVLVGKSDFLLFFCHSDAGGITLFFCELLYVFPPSSEWQTGYRKGRRDKKYLAGYPKPSWFARVSIILFSLPLALVVLPSALPMLYQRTEVHSYYMSHPYGICKC